MYRGWLPERRSHKGEPSLVKGVIMEILLSPAVTAVT
jgi:hypothetical protein